MIKYILLLVFALTYNSACFAQDSSLRVFKYVEQMPEPEYDVQKYLSENIYYPDDAYALNINGKVLIEFIVMEDGSITNARIVKSVYPPLDSEALRVVSRMPGWKPGRQNGKAVNIYFTVPITFNRHYEPQFAGEILSYPEHMPGAGYDLDRFFRKKTRYPRTAKKQHIEGTVNVLIKVDAEGKVIDAKVINSVHHDIDEEALRLVRVMPGWEPGKQNGKAVEVLYNLPIVFKLKK